MWKVNKKTSLYIISVVVVISVFIQGNWVLHSRRTDSNSNGLLRAFRKKTPVSSLQATKSQTVFIASNVSLFGRKTIIEKRNVSSFRREMLISKKTSLTFRREIQLRRATKLRFSNMYLFGAAAGNSTDNAIWDISRVYGIFDSKNDRNLRQDFNCCLKYKTKTGFENRRTPIINKWIFWANSRFRVFHFTCQNSPQFLHMIPEAVSLLLPTSPCDSRNTRYIKTFAPFKEPGIKLAIGTQIAYGNINADHIIDWLETYRYLGVDKVITYYYKLTNRKAMKVLEYYHNSGFVDLYRYVPVGQDVLIRDFEQKGTQLFNDLHLAVKDSFERMSGYTYFGIIDFDEYLIPSNNRTLKKMLSDLNKTYEKAAGFVFQSQYFYTSWGKSGHMNDLILGEYINCTSDSPKIDNPKQIYMPRVVAYGNAHVHNFDPVSGYKRVVVPAKEGFIRHYRKFRRRSNVTYMMNNVKRVTDPSLAFWSMRIVDKVHNIRRIISELQIPCLNKRWFLAGRVKQV